MQHVLSIQNRIRKRTFDLVFSLIGLTVLHWLIILAYIVATVDTKSNGFFIQKRVGKNGKHFNVIKIKTMRNVAGVETTVTKSSDIRITTIGALFRKTKIDELPQLLNIVLGNMSFVGPRPDVPGFADQLQGRERAILSLRPGITGPATLVFRNEEEILENRKNPEQYNREVIYPKKIELNLNYVHKYSFFKDIKYILATLVPGLYPNIVEDILSGKI